MQVGNLVRIKAIDHNEGKLALVLAHFVAGVFRIQIVGKDTTDLYLGTRLEVL